MWYVIFGQSGKEDRICELIRENVKDSMFQDDYRLLVPKRRINEKRQREFHEVVRTLFPGYILVNTKRIEELYEKTKNLPYVYHFLRANQEFQKVSECEIQMVLRLVDQQGIINVSKAVIENHRICVIEGPLCGMESSIRKVDRRKGRVRVGFHINERYIEVDLSINVMN